MGVIILVEDSVRFRSSLLPIIYSQLVRQTRAVMADGLNHMDKLLRMAARPKVLVAETYEQGLELFHRFRKHLFGVISDVSYPRGGRHDPQAGIAFIRQMQAELPDVPALLQSSDPANWQLAERLGVSFLHKKSPTLLEDVRNFMLGQFRLRRLRVPHAGRTGGSAGRRPALDGARAARRARRVDRVSRPAQPLLQLVPGADRVRAGAAACGRGASPSSATWRRSGAT